MYNDAIVQSYLSDPKVDVNKRKKLAADLDAGKIDINTVGKEIVMKTSREIKGLAVIGTLHQERLT